jgi:hypothetical protein
VQRKTQLKEISNGKKEGRKGERERDRVREEGRRVRERKEKEERERICFCSILFMSACLTLCCLLLPNPQRFISPGCHHITNPLCGGWEQHASCYMLSHKLLHKYWFPVEMFPSENPTGTLVGLTTFKARN